MTMGVHLEGGPVEIRVGLLESAVLVVAPHEGLDHPDPREVLLEHLVQVVEALLDLGEERPHDPYEEEHQQESDWEQ
jgi:hypothetical protein